MNENDFQFRGFGPLNEADIARLEARGAEMEHSGESYLAELDAQMQIEALTAKIARCRKVIAAADPADERLTRGREIMAGLEAKLSAWRFTYLAAWSADRSKPN